MDWLVCWWMVFALFVLPSMLVIVVVPIFVALIIPIVGLDVVVGLLVGLLLLALCIVAMPACMLVVV